MNGVCHYYELPGGCWNGSACRYAHTRSEGAPLTWRGDGREYRGAPGGPRGIARGRGRGRGGILLQAETTIPRAPDRICKFFQATGSCRFELNCTYRHVLQNPATTQSDGGWRRPRISPPVIPANVILQKIVGSSSSDALYPIPEARSYPETHALLRKYLALGYRFQNCSDIMIFNGLVSNVNEVHGKWTTEERQLLLTVLSDARGNSLRLIGSILGWVNVIVDGGWNQICLSFQHGYLPILAYLSSHSVVQSPMEQSINALYSLVNEHLENIILVLREIVPTLLARGSFRSSNPNLGPPSNGSQLFKTISIVMLEYMSRYKSAIIDHPDLGDFMADLSAWYQIWRDGVLASSPLFLEDNDPVQAYPDIILRNVAQGIERLRNILDRSNVIYGRGLPDHGTLQVIPVPGPSPTGLDMIYEGPGRLRAQGPRHSNDHVDIREIRIVPTHDELTSTALEYLPVNTTQAPHPYPSDSMQRLLDIQFRLLREDLIAPLRTPIQAILADLSSPAADNTTLGQLGKNRGGFYKGKNGADSIIVPVYTGVTFAASTPGDRGVSIRLVFDTPPMGSARSEDSTCRADFWEGRGKRLMQRGLVALIWTIGSESKVYLGTITSSTKDLVESTQTPASRLAICVSFFDLDIELRVLEELTNNGHDSQAIRDATSRILIEAPVMFESVRPFLEALRAEPTTIPFPEYLAHPGSGTLANITCRPPVVPDFEYDLASLFHDDAGVQSLMMQSLDTESVRGARAALKAPHPLDSTRLASRLDYSQSDAIIDALTREVALIQGPPGTGKSYTGVELIRVLIKNQIRPIIMIAVTNHALDHMLKSIMDADITENLIRLGSRSKDERISALGLEELLKLHERSRMSPQIDQAYDDIKDIETDIDALKDKISKKHIVSADIRRFIECDTVWHGHHRGLLDPPDWVRRLISDKLEEQRDIGDGWRRVHHQTRRQGSVTDLYEYWRLGQDLEYIRRAPPAAQKPKFEPQATEAPHSFHRFGVLDESPDNPDDDEDSDTELPPVLAWTVALAPQTLSVTDPRQEFFRSFGMRAVPLEPKSKRSLVDLRSEPNIWDYSLSEREVLAQEWSQCAMLQTHQIEIEEYTRLLERHATELQRLRQLKDTARIDILRRADLVACTTNGAARLEGLVKAFGPRVMLVEEAGQVLEAHVLSCLVPSIQHLIMIGDPSQLRPTINNYSLSTDHHIGGKLYRFDQSLMERLASLNLFMSRLDVQRRMRPEVSSLIRNTLYPQLQDHHLVKGYPRLRGVASNVFFLDHRHPEGGGGDTITSKSNKFEALMAADLVLHFLRQGIYSAQGSIVVLCAYLGQLVEIRKQLAGKVITVLDERDMTALSAAGDDLDAPVGAEQVQVSSRVLLRTVDNFQGEEADIVILSTVRNSGTINEDHSPVKNSNHPGHPTIGFLKSPNRTNVALSRAKIGMIILGDASLLASQSVMWTNVIENIRSTGGVGEAIPITCHRHPDEHILVDTPGQISRFCPDGGCLRPCNARLLCGHICPFKCHSDDENHVSMNCSKKCTKRCSEGHPCRLRCSQPCGPCPFPVERIELLCGHIKPRVTCHQSQHLDEIECGVMVTKIIPNCGHEVEIRCSDDPEDARCRKQCDIPLTCCSRPCSSNCHDCKLLNPKDPSMNAPTLIARMLHKPHPCGKPLLCGHACSDDCKTDHKCSGNCRRACRQTCSHAKCSQWCSTPCAPCLEPCGWSCPHQTCPAPCGSICARLPCDVKCKNTLPCGHPCPSLCGENCSEQVCPRCLNLDGTDPVVDLIMHRTLSEIDLSSENLDEILITIPHCRHVFTVETLDGVCGLGEHYDQSADGTWSRFKEPPKGATKFPICPTCRSDITASRYGRVVRRAQLDLLEQNWSSSRSQVIAGIQRTIVGFNKASVPPLFLLKYRRAPAKASLTPKETSLKKHEKEFRGILRNKTGEPTSISRLQELTGIEPAAEEWEGLVKPLLNAYELAAQTAVARSAHSQAYDAAFSRLYQQEMEHSAQQSIPHGSNYLLPEERAMRVSTARMQLGQPRPLADRRYQVEAAWATVSIRFILAEVSEKWAASLPSSSPNVKHRWSLFSIDLLRSALHDAQVTHAAAVETNSHRQALKSAVLVERAKFEVFRLNYVVTFRGRPTPSVRETFKTGVRDHIVAFTDAADTIRTTYQVSRVSELPESKETWLVTNFDKPISALKEAWDSLGRTIQDNTYYIPVSLDEKMAIASALSFGYGGHFYQCPEGHTYVITECGGAMERSQCPECGAAIGGDNHHLDSANRRDTEMERILMEQGARPDPFRWVESDGARR